MIAKWSVAPERFPPVDIGAVRGLLDDPGTDEDEVRAAGAVLARLHASLATHPDALQVPSLVTRTTTVRTEVTGGIDQAPDQVPATRAPPCVTWPRRT